MRSRRTLGSSKPHMSAASAAGNRVGAARRRGAGDPVEALLQMGHPGAQPLGLLAGCHREILQDLDLLAAGHLHLVEEALELALHHALHLAPDTLRGTGGIGDQAGEFVEKAVVGLHHRKSSGSLGASRALPRMWGVASLPAMP